MLVLDAINYLTRKFTTMKFLKIIILSLGTIATGTLYLSCTKTVPSVPEKDTNLANSALVQVFNATVKAARNYVYVDAVPVSGVAFAYGGVFPGTAFAFRATPGLRIFLIKDTLITSTQTPLSFTQNLAAGASYTIFTYDTITSAKETIVQNNIVLPTDTTARLRFGNFVYNPSSLPAVDVYSFRRGPATPVFTNVATNSVTEFIPYQSGFTDSLYIYAAGTTSPLLLKAPLQATGLTPQRSYTTVYNGSYRGTKVLSTFLTY
jgi:hypothetical protein